MRHLQRLIDFLFNPPLSAPRSVVIVRLMAGGVFLSEGILKFVYTSQGVGRFTKLGIPAPELTATFVGSLESVGGLLLIAGLFTRVIAVPFIIEVAVAILTTKIALYLGTSPLPLPPAPPKMGFWAVMHETRSDYAQILTSIFLLIVGPGSWSLDALLRRRREPAIARWQPARDAFAASFRPGSKGLTRGLRQGYASVRRPCGPETKGMEDRAFNRRRDRPHARDRACPLGPRRRTAARRAHVGNVVPGVLAPRPAFSAPVDAHRTYFALGPPVSGTTASATRALRGDAVERGYEAQRERSTRILSTGTGASSTRDLRQCRRQHREGLSTTDS